MASSTGFKDLPSDVKEYSTLGGTSANTSLSTSPSSSSARKSFVKTFLLIAGTLSAGTCVPFVHSHKQNEEIYAILNGEGKAVIDGETVYLKSGDWLRVSPSAKRQFFASADKALKYICIQVKYDSLEGYTMTDAVV